MFAKIQNDKVVEWPIASITALFPNTSFPEVLTDKSMPEGYVMVETISPPTIKTGKRAEPGNPVKQGGKWVQSWNIVDIPQEEINEQVQALASSIRFERNQKIAESDWVILKAYERQATPPKEWVDYRQALREVTNQPDFPRNVAWPVAPE